MTSSLDLYLVDPGGGDRPVTVPGEARIDRLAERLAGHVHGGPHSGWQLRRAGEATSLPGERTLRQAGVGPGERIELVAPETVASAAPPPLPPPPDGRRRSGGPVVAAVLVAVVLLAAGGAFAATRLLDDSGSDSTAPTPAEWASELGGSESGTAAESPGFEEEEEEASGEDEIPAMTREEIRAEVSDLLGAHHTAIVDGEYQDAWNLLSARKRRQYLSEGDGYSTWKKNQSTLAAYLDPEGLRVSILAIDRVEGVVTVRLSGMGWSAPGTSCSEWSGITWVRYERGGWYYDPGYSTTPSRERAWKPKYAKLLGGSC